VLRVDELMPDHKRYFEDYAYVLDYLPFGYPERGREPIAQAVGRMYFTLFELLPRPMINLEVGELVYIGHGERAKIRRVSRRILYPELTATARAELPNIVEKIVTEREADFVRFFNEAGPISPRMHALEALPGIGKKMLNKILEERRAKPFESFEDIKRRTGLPDPKRTIVQRILKELRGEEVRVFFAKGCQLTMSEREARRYWRRRRI